MPRNAPANAPTQRLAAIAPGICNEAYPIATPTTQSTNNVKTKKWSISLFRLPKPSQHFTRSSSMWAATQIGNSAGSRKAPHTDPISIELVKSDLSTFCSEFNGRHTEDNIKLTPKIPAVSQPKTIFRDESFTKISASLDNLASRFRRQIANPLREPPLKP